MITLSEYLTAAGRDLTADCCTDHLFNARELLGKVNAALEAFDAHRGAHFPAIVTSGYRTPAINKCIPNAAKKLLHMTGQAIDIRDRTGELDAYFLSGAGALVLMRCGLWLEHPSATPNWCHLQSLAPRSGSNPFYP